METLCDPAQRSPYFSSPAMDKMKQGVINIKKKVDTTGLVVTGVGALVSGVGATMRRSKWGVGILGFGLAHVALGLLDMIRPTVKNG